MTPLTGKQKRFLRGLGQSLRAGVLIGKEGVTEGVVSAADGALARHELVKVRMPAGPATVRKAVAEQLATGAGAACIGVVGRTALLYRPNDDLPDEARIDLPL